MASEAKKKEIFYQQNKREEEEGFVKDKFIFYAETWSKVIAKNLICNIYDL